MEHIFVCYSRKDQSFALKLKEFLENAGKDVWIDLEDLPTSSIWREEIQAAITEAVAFIYLISFDSIESKYCQKEFDCALQSKIKIFPILLDGVMDKDIPQNVTSFQWLQWKDLENESYRKKFIIDIETDLEWAKACVQIRLATQIWADNQYNNAFLWPEERLKKFRAMMQGRVWNLNQTEVEFLRSEQERLLHELQNNSTTHQRRSAIGERLSIIGDTRAGIGLLSNGLPDIKWCRFGNPSTPQLLTYMTNLGVFEINLPLYFSKYLITYKQFQMFIQDKNGFHNSRWWEGLDTNEDDISKPGGQRFVFDNYPRENVSLYDAIAFCRWFSSRILEISGKNPTSEMDLHDPFTWVVRLPTEIEWNFVATGGKMNKPYIDMRRSYPWGNEWNDFFANTTECGLGRTTAVGMYPNGAAECGALDMCGNVWEWTLTKRDSRQSFDIIGNEIRILLGGSWLNDSHEARINSNIGSLPWKRLDDFGFRVCGNTIDDFPDFWKP